MKKNLSLSFILFLFLAIACNSNKGKSKQVVILCDASKSTVNNQDVALEAVLDKCHYLLYCFDAETTLTFLPVSEDRYQKPLLTFTPAKVNDATLDEEKQRMASEYEKLAQALRNFSKTNGSTTCLLTSIENGLGIMDRDAEDNTEKQMIILSDMKEECKNSFAGKIMMSDGYDANAISTQIKNTKFPSFQYNDVTLDVFITTANSTTSQANQNLEKVWSEVFNQFNFKNKDNVRFSQTLRFKQRAAFKEK